MGVLLVTLNNKNFNLQLNKEPASENRKLLKIID